MKSKGFTLVELLAVIAIMALLITLAVPSIIKLYNDAKKNAFKVEAESIIKAAEEGYAVSILSKDVEETIYTYTDGSESHTGNISMYISGNKPKNGEVKINTEGQVSIALHNGEYCATKNYTSKEVIVEKRTLEECISLQAVTSAECFVTDLSLASPTIQFYYNDFSGASAEMLNEYGLILPDALEDNETIIYYYDYQNLNCPDDVVIPRTLNDKNVVALGLGAFNVIDEEEQVFSTGMGITSVILPNTLKYIGAISLDDNLLEEIIIPNSVTRIGTDSFASNNLINVNISSESSLISIGAGAFAYNQIQNVTIPNGVTSIGWNAFMFNHLTSVTIPNSVTYLGAYSFAYNQLTNVTLSNNLSEILYASFENNQLTNIAIPNSTVSIETEAFRYNNILQGDATIDNFEGSVTIGDNVFANNGADRLTTITPVYLRVE